MPDLEPVDYCAPATDSASLKSLAISTKRIADSLDRLINAMIHLSIEEAAAAAGNTDE